jgi:Xaa-Pro dipeptidase
MSIITELAKTYPEHIKTLQERTQHALKREGIDGLIIHSGQTKRMFLDDNHYPFVVNPHFKAWLPLIEHPNCWLIIDGESKPKLIFYRPRDFWHKVHDLPNAYWTEYFDIEFLTHANAVEKHLPFDKRKYAYIGEYIEVAKALGFELVNPDRVMHYLHYHRAYKTDYELVCMREANRIAIRGHKAAQQAFSEKASELTINIAYLKATQHQAHQLPYNNIVGLNQNAAILHYTDLQVDPPPKQHSLLIDAGASFQGYAADITRTYSHGSEDFAQLIQGVSQVTQNTIEQVKPGVSFVDIHNYAYLQIGQLLADHGLVNLEAKQACEKQIVSHFFPHGIGHLLGLQVHDVAGHMRDDRGTLNTPSKQHPFLRSSRIIEPKQVFTIEPGLYFIDSLLKDLKASEHSKYINWNRVDHFRQFGGIRIEDNIIVHRDRNENITTEQGLTYS